MNYFFFVIIKEKSEKTQHKVNEMNDAISYEVKSRVRQVTAKHKGYEQIDEKPSNVKY